MMRAPLVPVTLAFIAGIWGFTLAPRPLPVLIGAGLLMAGTALCARRNDRCRTSLLIICWGVLGFLRAEAWSSAPEGRWHHLLPGEPASVRIHGVVIDDPIAPFEPGEAFNGSEAGAAAPRICVVRLRHARATDGWRPMAGRLRAAFSQPAPPLSYGDEIVAEGEWSSVPPPGNPGQYDWRAALARQRIHGLLRVKPMHGVVLLEAGRGRPWMAAIFRLRRRWERLIRDRFTTEEAGVLLSLLLGRRVALDERLKDAFVETGTIHLLVISGFNVGLIAGLLELLLRLAGLPWRMRLALSTVGLGGYALLTGWQPPVVRATLMAWVVFGACALDRVISWSNTLAAAALAIIWWDPFQIFDPGFQLSFGAVLCLLVFTGRWQARLERALRWMRPAWLRRYAALSLSATSAVWIGLAPILAWYFQLVAPVSLLANLLIAPLMSALVAAGTALLMAAGLIERVMAWGHGPLRALVMLTLAVVRWCHAIPGGVWFVPPPPAPFLAGYYGLLALSLLRSRLGLRPGGALIAWGMGLAVWVWSAAALRAGDERWLRVDMLDVGHGDSMVIRTPAHHTLLVDAGSQEAGRHRVLPFLRHEGVTTLDALILTHDDEDHLGGAIPLLQHLTIRRLFTNGARGRSASAGRVRSLAAAQRIEADDLTAGMRMALGHGVELAVLHPPRGFVPGTTPASNDNCLVLKLTRGARGILLTGDIEEAGLPWLLGAGEALRADVLKVPHHGSRLGGAGNAFFRAVQPEVALLSVGRLHHLPAPETLRALRETGAALSITRDDGAISLRTDGERLELRAFRDRR